MTGMELEPPSFKAFSERSEPLCERSEPICNRIVTPERQSPSGRHHRAHLRGGSLRTLGSPRSARWVGVLQGT